MAHGGAKPGSVRTGSRKKISISFGIRDVEEKLNRSGVNALSIDPTNQMLYTAGRDAIIRMWDVKDSDKGDIQVCALLEVDTDTSLIRALSTSPQSKAAILEPLFVSCV